jgi:hypothetical protein
MSAGLGRVEMESAGFDEEHHTRKFPRNSGEKNFVLRPILSNPP